METTVVDIHKIKGKRPKYDVYIGRKVRNTEFTEDSIWANLYKFITDQNGNPIHTIEEILLLYEAHIRAKILTDSRYDIESLRNKKLGCWCRNPDKCHGSVLIKIIKEIDKYNSEIEELNKILEKQGLKKLEKWQRDEILYIRGKL